MAKFQIKRQRKNKRQVAKNRLITRWRLRRSVLIGAIKEIQNGGGTICTSMEEFDKQMAE